MVGIHMQKEVKMLVELEGVRCRRGSFVLDIPSWRLEEGCVLGLVGPNAAGKSTLLELLAGVLRADEGRVSVFGKAPWHEVAAVRSQLGIMNDHYPVPRMKVGALLKMVSGYYEGWDESLVKSLLERFSLDPALRTHALSKGQKTRLRLILAMAFRPKLLLLDEPASGLDLAGRRVLLQAVLEYVKEPQRSVVISTHLLSEVERIADTLLVLNEGRVVKEGSTDELVGDERTLEEALLVWDAAGVVQTAQKEAA